MRGGMLMRVIYLVYKWCWIISSDLHRQYAFGEHSPLSAIFLFIIAMHDKHLVHETATLSILDSNIDFESHAIIDSPPHNHQHITGTFPQHCQCFDLLLISVCIQHALSSGRARGHVTIVCAVNSRQHHL